MSVLSSTEAYVKTLELDEAGHARADIALSLAQTFDRAVEDERATVIQSVPGIGKELRETLAELEGLQGAAEQFVGELFVRRTSEVSDTAREVTQHKRDRHA